MSRMTGGCAASWSTVVPWRCPRCGARLGALENRVTNRDQLDGAMRPLFASDGPALLCVEQDAELW